MNNKEKVISNIKKAIKEHLDNNYAYDMLVDFELDVIDWNSLLEYINQLQQENKQLQEELECTIGIVEHNRIISEKNKEIHQLKDNWIKLKKFIGECLEAINTIQKLTGNAIENYTPRILTYNQIKDKMQEMERSDSDV